MEKIKQSQKDINLEFNEILKTEKDEKNILKGIEKLLSKDNTNPHILLKYLLLKLKCNEKDFPVFLEKYSYFLPKEILKSNFNNYNIKKKSSIEFFQILYEKIEHYSKGMDINYRIDFYLNFKTIPLDKEFINNYVSYDNNPELYLGLLYNETIGLINSKIEDLKFNKREGKNEYIESLEEEINELKIYKKVKKFNIIQNEDNNFKEVNEEEIRIYNNFIKKTKNENIDVDKELEDLNSQLIFIYKISSEAFEVYFTRFSLFLKGIKTKFFKRFWNLENSKSKEDFELFAFFCFFIGHFDFCELTQFYINLWDYSLKQNIEEINEILNENSYKNVNKYFIKDNELILEIYDNNNNEISILKVRNFSKYIIPNIIDYLSLNYQNLKKKEDERKRKQSFFGEMCNYFISFICEKEIDKNNYEINEKIINEYYIEKYLKIEEYKNEIYIKTKWNIWINFLMRIFTSKTIKDAFNKFSKTVESNFDLFDFLNENQLKSIFDNINLFQFPISGIYGITLSSPLLKIYEYYEGFISKYGDNISKLLSLCFHLITNEHEVLGHLNIRIQNIILKKNIKSPIVDKHNNLKERNEESGDFIEKLLYGYSISELTYNQMLFILDENNYTLSLDNFKEKFLEVINSNYEPSQSLKDLLNSLDIDLENNITSNNLNFKYTFGQKVSKKNNLIFRKGFQHENGSFDYSPQLEKRQLILKGKIKELSKKVKNNKRLNMLNNK